ncbi:MAG TPA: nucleotidyltransferase domain-containing protein [Afifellaceae bacterium]|nr:nucleotidyltransferase domain-containing protein [Afifellaceae bacterium]
MDQQIVSRIKALDEPIRAKGATGLYIYGSRARGDHRPDSDLDVLVEYDPGTKFSLIELVVIKHMLEDALGLEVHISTRNGLSRYFRDEVEAQAIRIL